MEVGSPADRALGDVHPVGNPHVNMDHGRTADGPADQSDGCLRAGLDAAAWIAFRIAHGWTRTPVLCALIGAGGYLLAYLATLALDQPFGPVLVAVLVTLAASVEAGRGLIGISLARLRRKQR